MTDRPEIVANLAAILKTIADAVGHEPTQDDYTLAPPAKGDHQ